MRISVLVGMDKVEIQGRVIERESERGREFDDRDNPRPMHSKLLELPIIAIILSLINDRNNLRPKQSKLFQFCSMDSIKNS